MEQPILNMASDIGVVRPIVERELVARFEAVRPRLTAVCTAVVGAEEARDLVQETFLRARDRLRRLRDPGGGAALLLLAGLSLLAFRRRAPGES